MKTTVTREVHTGSVAQMGPTVDPSEQPDHSDTLSHTGSAHSLLPGCSLLTFLCVAAPAVFLLSVTSWMCVTNPPHPTAINGFHSLRTNCSPLPPYYTSGKPTFVTHRTGSIPTARVESDTVPPMCVVISPISSSAARVTLIHSGLSRPNIHIEYWLMVFA